MQASLVILSKIMSVYLSNLSVFSSLTALLATVPIPLRKIFSSLRLCLTWILTIMLSSCHSSWQGQPYHLNLTFPWSLSTCSTVSPSWPIVSLETKIQKFSSKTPSQYWNVWSLFHSPVMAVHLAYPLESLGVVVTMSGVHSVQPGSG